MVGKRIGVKNFTVAKLLSDNELGATYDNPIRLPEVQKISLVRPSNRVDVEADDRVVDTLVGYGAYQLGIDLASLLNDHKAMLLGQTVTNGIRDISNEDIAPYWCVMFQSRKSTGKYEYWKVLKVQFSEPNENFETKKQALVVQPLQLQGVGIDRIFDGKPARIADEDSETYTPSVGASWFTSGDIAPDTTLPSLASSTPANNGTGVAVTSTFQWVFSKPILPGSALSLANLFLVKDADGAPVSGTLQQSADKKTVTFTPSTNLTAATAYRAIATRGVRDLSGNYLVQNDIRKFTTA